MIKRKLVWGISYQGVGTPEYMSENREITIQEFMERMPEGYNQIPFPEWGKHKTFYSRWRAYRKLNPVWELVRAYVEWEVKENA